MVRGAFSLHCPSDLASALGVLTEYDDDARVIAGGHSLVPMNQLRMAQVDHLVDLQDIAELRASPWPGPRDHRRDGDACRTDRA